MHQAWRGKKITLRQAAEACGIRFGIFCTKTARFEKPGLENAESFEKRAVISWRNLHNNAEKRLQYPSFESIILLGVSLLRF